MKELEEKVRAYFGKYLRRLFQRSPIRAAVYEANYDGVSFSCYVCKGRSKVKSDFQVEHVSPVVPPERDNVPSFEYFVRMFGYQDGGITIDNLKLCCIHCHEVKTAEERAVRIRLKTGPYSARAREKRYAKPRKKLRRKSRKSR